MVICDLELLTFSQNLTMGCGASTVGVVGSDEHTQTQTKRLQHDSNTNNLKANRGTTNGVLPKQKTENNNNARLIDTNGNTLKTDQTPGEYTG